MPEADYYRDEEGYYYHRNNNVIPCGGGGGGGGGGGPAERCDWRRSMPEIPQQRQHPQCGGGGQQTLTRPAAGDKPKKSSLTRGLGRVFAKKKTSTTSRNCDKAAAPHGRAFPRSVSHCDLTMGNPSPDSPYWSSTASVSRHISDSEAAYYSSAGDSDYGYATGSHSDVRNGGAGLRSVTFGEKFAVDPSAMRREDDDYGSQSELFGGGAVRHQQQQYCRSVSVPPPAHQRQQQACGRDPRIISRKKILASVLENERRLLREGSPPDDERRFEREG